MYYILLHIQTRPTLGNAGTFLQLEPGAGADLKHSLSEPHFLKEGCSLVVHIILLPPSSP